MEQQRTKHTAASSSASSGSSSSFSSRSIHNSMSSAFLGVSPSTSSQSQRRSSPSSLYPAPLGSSRGSAAASGGSASASPSSQSHEISASPRTVARRRPRPHTRLTHSLPTPFLAELSAIRRISANVFGDLDAIQRPALLHGRQQQEMTRSSSSFTMPQPHSHQQMPISIGEFSGFQSSSQQQQALTMRGLPAGFAPPPLQQQQAQPSSFSSLQPLPGGGNFSGFPLAPSQPHHMQPSSSSSTDLPSRVFSSGFEQPAASQHFSSYDLAPLPSGSTIFQSYSSCSADHAPPLFSSDSELPPLPPSLEIRQCDLPPLGQLSSTVYESRSAFEQPSESYELAPLPESLQMTPRLLRQVKQEPVAVAPRLEPEIISLDDDDDEFSAVVHSFASSHGHGSAPSLPNHMHDQQPTNSLEHGGMHRLQLGGSGSELTMTGVAEGAGVSQTSEATRMPPAGVHDMVNNGSGSSRSITWNYSRSEDQALQQLSNLISRWSSTASSTSSDQSMGSSVAGSSSADLPALAERFEMMSIRGNSSLSVQNSNPVPDVPKLILGGMDRPRSLRGSTKELYFSEAEMERITIDNRLKELAKTDSKRVKRILRNRESVARLKLRKANQLEDLQRRADALNMECSSLSAQVQSHQEMVDKLRTGNRALEIELKGLKDLDNLKEALNHQLQSELQRLKLGS